MSALTPWRSLEAELDGVRLSHQMRPGEAPILMVHGVGPGTTGRLNFAPLFERLSSRFALHVIDLAGFGASGRISRPPFFNVDFWLRQIGGAIDRIQALHGRPPMLVGNSVGGALVLKAAAARPDLLAILAIAAPVAPPATDALRAFWTAPVNARALACAMQPMTGAAAEPDPALVDARLQAFKTAEDRDYFNAMLADPDACVGGVALQPEEAASIRSRVMLLHGRLDRACPAVTTLAGLAPLLPDADVVLFGGCGHNVISERPEAMVAAIERLAEGADRR